MSHPATSHISMTDARADDLAEIEDILLGKAEPHWARLAQLAMTVRDLRFQHHDKASRAEFRRRREEELAAEAEYQHEVFWAMAAAIDGGVE